MTGKTHKAVGLCVGIAFTYWGTKTFGDPMFAVSAIASVAGAMLPDIDHNNSKIGSKRKVVVDAATKVLSVLFGLIVLSLCVAMVVSGLYEQLVLFLLLIIIPVIVLSIVAHIPFVRSALKFSIKHRGIMHTLTVPLILYLGFSITSNTVARFGLLAMAAGYTSHLVLDCLTKRGCPVLWPITSKNISVLSIRTGSVWEYVLGYAFVGGIILITIFRL